MFCVLPACHVNRLCGRLACFKKGLNGLATLAVYLELHAALGGEAKTHSPREPEKCHAGHINQPLTEHQLPTGPWRQPGGDES